MFNIFFLDGGVFLWKKYNTRNNRQDSRRADRHRLCVNIVRRIYIKSYFHIHRQMIKEKYYLCCKF